MGGVYNEKAIPGTELYIQEQREKWWSGRKVPIEKHNQDRMTSCKYWASLSKPVRKAQVPPLITVFNAGDTTEHLRSQIEVE